jgi:hypothetical protein
VEFGVVVAFTRASVLLAGAGVATAAVAIGATVATTAGAGTRTGDACKKMEKGRIIHGLQASKDRLPQVNKSESTKSTKKPYV